MSKNSELERIIKEEIEKVLKEFSGEKEKPEEEERWVRINVDQGTIEEIRKK